MSWQHGPPGAIKLVDEDGVAFGIKQIGNKPRISAMPYTYDIAEGNIPDHETRRAIGYNNAVGVGIEDLAEQGGLITTPTVATAMQIDGSDVADTGVVIYTSTATGGTVTTLEDTAQDFTAGSVVEAGDMVLLDDDISVGIVTGVAPTVLTCADGFSKEGLAPNAGANYRVIDNSAGGAGAQLIEVDGLDANYAEIGEFVVTNGAGVRALVNNYLRINTFHTMLAGANGLGTGTILLEDQATGAITYAQITGGGSMMLQALYTVPAGKTMYLTDWTAGASGGQPARVHLRATVDYDDRVYLPNVFLFQDIMIVQNSTLGLIFPLPLKMPAKTDVKLSAYGAATTPGVGGSFGFWLETES